MRSFRYTWRTWYSIVFGLRKRAAATSRVVHPVLRVLAVVPLAVNHGPVSVLGGTGAYAGATGTGFFKQLNKAGTRTKVTVHLA